MEWVSPVEGELTRVALDVAPPEAFRQVRVRRANGDLLANESWDQSRTRGVRIWPADRAVAVGERLRLEAVAWWDKCPVELTAVLHWGKDGPDDRG